MTIQSKLLKREKLREKYLTSHSKGRDATVGRILANRTTVFVIKPECTVLLAFAHARIVSTILVLRSLLKSLIMLRKSLQLRARL